MLSHSQQETLSVLRNRTWRRLGLLTHRSEEKRIQALCRKLEEDPSPFLVPPLAAILIHFPLKFRLLLCETYQCLIQQIPSDQWNFIDQETRHEIQASIYQLNHAKQPNLTPNLKDDREHLIALSHPSGFVRESAVTAIKPPISEAAFSLLFLRCIDWAEPVAKAAQAKISSLPVQFFEGRLNELLDTLFLLNRSTRPISIQVRNQLEKIILSQPDGISAVLSSLEETQNQNRRRMASVFLVRHSHKLPDELIRRLLTYGTPAHVLAFLRGAKDLPEQRQKLLLEHTKTATSAPIRRERLRLLSQIDPEGSQSDFEAALCDPSRSIRSISRFYLKDWSKEKCAAHYLELLHDHPSPRILRASLTGLSEVAPKEAHTIAINRLPNADNPTKLKTCILCLNLHSRDVGPAMVFNWLKSSSTAVAHVSYRQIIIQDLKLPEEELGTMVAQSTIPPLSRILAMKLLSHTNKWNSLHWALKGTVNDLPEVVEFAHWKLNTWLRTYSRSAISPTKQEITRVRETFKTVQNHLEPDLVIRFQSLLAQL